MTILRQAIYELLSSKYVGQKMETYMCELCQLCTNAKVSPWHIA